MANYTMTINDCLNNPLTPLFDFEYPFYVDDENAKNLFEEKFILYYLNCEIGFETFARFQNALKSHLVIKMPYYKQLYETVMASEDINFLLNKDLTESTTRELSGVESGTGNRTLSNEESVTGSRTLNNEETQTLSATSSATGEFSSTNQTTSNSKTSQLNDGVSSVSLEDGYLTGTSSDNQTITDNQNSQSTGNNQQESTGSGTQSEQQTNSRENSQTEEETSRRENNQTETITLTSQGNIGITSSAELLEKWRSVLINLDEIIIKDCRDLFMKIY